MIRLILGRLERSVGPGRREDTQQQAADEKEFGGKRKFRRKFTMNYCVVGGVTF